jgi:hypothetical protein
MKVYIKHPEYDEQINTLVNELLDGNDITIDNVDILDHLLTKQGDLVRNATFISGSKQDYEMSYNTVYGMRCAGLSIFPPK